MNPAATRITYVNNIKINLFFKKEIIYIVGNAKSVESINGISGQNKHTTGIIKKNKIAWLVRTPNIIKTGNIINEEIAVI